MTVIYPPDEKTAYRIPASWDVWTINGRMYRRRGVLIERFVWHWEFVWDWELVPTEADDDALVTWTT